MEESSGNPFALHELWAVRREQLLLEDNDLLPRLPLSQRLEDVFMHRVRRLPEAAPRLLLVAPAGEEAPFAEVVAHHRSDVAAAPSRRPRSARGGGATSALAVLAALGASRQVELTPPIAALRDPDVVDRRRRFVPLVAAAVLAAAAVSMVASIPSSLEQGANRLPAALLAGAHTTTALAGADTSGSIGAGVALLIGGPVLVVELVVLASADRSVPFDAGLPALLVTTVLVTALMTAATAVPALADLRRPVRSALSVE